MTHVGVREDGRRHGCAGVSESALGRLVERRTCEADAGAARPQATDPLIELAEGGQYLVELTYRRGSAVPKTLQPQRYALGVLARDGTDVEELLIE